MDTDETGAGRRRRVCYDAEFELVRKMPAGNLAVIGAQWGDEGKGKIVDLLAPSFSVVARYQGGHNAGHTVHASGRKFVLHLVPSGILHADVTCVIGNGVVVDPIALFEELDQLVAEGIEPQGRLIISDRAHVIFPYHRDIERVAEESRGSRPIGTTSRGIGPAYEDKAARRGVRMADLADLAGTGADGPLAHTVRANVDARNRLCGGPPVSWSETLADLRRVWQRLEPMVADVSKYLSDAIDENRRVLFEGAQGTMLDVDHGTYPFVSSSNGSIGGVCTGLGVGPRVIGRVLGIVKSYTTRVGEGPLPTELEGDAGDALRESGQEYGASTGRPRRCGWFDAVVARYAARINGLDALALTKLDVLDSLDEVQVCVGYRYGGQRVTELPADPSVLAECEPEYETWPGWSAPTAGVRTFSALPSAAQQYVARLEALTGVPVAIVSTGSDRADTIIRKDSVVTTWLPASE